MSDTIELPPVLAVRRRVGRNGIARGVLRLKLTRAYDGVRLTRSDLELLRRAHDLLRQTSPEPEVAPRRVSVADVEIRSLYQEIALLDAERRDDVVDAERARKLARLRELQHAEADRADRWIKAHRDFDPKSAREAIRRAEGLIARHARPS